MRRGSKRSFPARVPLPDTPPPVAHARFVREISPSRPETDVVQVNSDNCGFIVPVFSEAFLGLNAVESAKNAGVDQSLRSLGEGFGKIADSECCPGKSALIVRLVRCRERLQMAHRRKTSKNRAVDGTQRST